MSSGFHPLRTIPSSAQYKAGDVLVVFGELFSRGYANGIVDEAERAGLTVIRTTVGRREATGLLRALTPDELAQQPQPFINIPLEAGFDMEPCSQDGSTPIDQIKSLKMSEWDQAQINWDKLKDSRARATERFRNNTTSYLTELEKHIPKGANVIFVHTMAGGVPRAKIMMPTMNRVFKGVGDRHLSSEQFWNTDLGRFCAMNFDDVTALTFEHLIELSQTLREKIKADGGSVRYLAYGYHGTEVLTKGEFVWQSYAPYLQGWAKLKLEDIAKKAWSLGVSATVYNCPEILTNSSSIFVGVEVPLYPLLGALRRVGSGSAKIQSILGRAQELLKPEHSFDEIQSFTDEVLSSEPIRRHCEFSKWPQHNGKEQMEYLISSSERLVSMHKNEKELITFLLSEEVFRATGHIMYHDCWKPQAPVLWLGHDVLANALANGKTL